MCCFLAENQRPFKVKYGKNGFIFLQNLLMDTIKIVNKLLSKFGTNPGQFKKVIKILKTLTTE